jgi:hypothetical protein
VQEEGGAVGGYLATYLLPMLAVAPTTVGEWLAYGVYGIVAFTIFVKTDLGLVNPTLYILGWRVVSARQRGSEAPHIVLCRHPVELRSDEGVLVSTLAGCLVVKVR